MQKEPTRRTKGIVFIQPTFARYRQTLFEKLHGYFDITFYFQDPQVNLRFQDSRVYLRDTHSKMFTYVYQPSKKHDANRLLYRARRYLDLLLFLMRTKYLVTVTSTPLSPPTIISLFVSKIKKRKCIVWVEDWFIPKCESAVSKFRCFLVFFLTKFVLRIADAIVVEGSPQYRYVETLGISNDRIFFSNHCSLDFSSFKSKDLKKELGIEKSLVVLYLGRIVEQKGLDVLIKAFSRIEKKRGDVFLVVCGEGGFRVFCEDLAKKLKIEHIIFTGEVSEVTEVASYYKTADAFVVPSCIRPHQEVLLRAFSGRAGVEGWGLVVNEAMSMSKPVITTDAVGAAENLVRNGVNGYVVKNGDVEELFLSMTKILEDKQLRKSMGKNSRRIFEEFNDLDKMFEGFKNAIEYVAR